MLGIFRTEPAADTATDNTEPTTPPRRRGFRQQAADAETAMRDVQAAVQALTSAALGISLVSLVALLMAGWAIHKASTR